MVDSPYRAGFLPSTVLSKSLRKNSCEVSSLLPCWKGGVSPIRQSHRKPHHIPDNLKLFQKLLFFCCPPSSVTMGLYLFHLFPFKKQLHLFPFKKKTQKRFDVFFGGEKPMGKHTHTLFQWICFPIRFNESCYLVGG